MFDQDVVADSDVYKGPTHPMTFSTPGQPVQNVGCDSLNTTTNGTPIRPLTAAYKAAATESNVSLLRFSKSTLLAQNICHILHNKHVFI